MILLVVLNVIAFAFLIFHRRLSKWKKALVILTVIVYIPMALLTKGSAMPFLLMLAIYLVLSSLHTYFVYDRRQK